MPPERRDDDLGAVEHALHVALRALLDELELVVVADHDPRAVDAVVDVRAIHHRKLMRRVKDEWHLAFSALANEPSHRSWIIGADDHCIDPGRRVVEAEVARSPHRSAVIARELIVIHVGRGESSGAHLAFDEAEPATVDVVRDQPVAIFGRVRPRGGEHRGGMAEQREVVGVVAGHAALSLLEVVDQEAQVQDMSLVGKDVVLEAALEGEDVVVGDRASAEDHRFVSVRRLTENRRDAPLGTPLTNSAG